MYKYVSGPDCLAGIELEETIPNPGSPKPPVSPISSLSGAISSPTSPVTEVSSSYGSKEKVQSPGLLTCYQSPLRPSSTNTGPGSLH